MNFLGAKEVNHDASETQCGMLPSINDLMSVPGMMRGVFGVLHPPPPPRPRAQAWSPAEEALFAQRHRLVLDRPDSWAMIADEAVRTRDSDAIRKYFENAICTRRQGKPLAQYDEVGSGSLGPSMLSIYIYI